MVNLRLPALPGIVAALLLALALPAAHVASAEDLLQPGVPGAAGAAAKPADDPVVARVDGVELRRSDVMAARRSLPQRVQQMPLEQIYPALLDQMVSGVVVAEAGRKADLQDDPEVKKRTAQLEDRVIEEVYLTRAVEKGVTEERLRTRYAAFIKENPQKEEVKASHILVAKEDDAKAIIVELQKGADFASLAKQRSTDPGGKTGGDLGWFTRDEMVPEFADAAFKLKPGEFTRTPVKTQFGWHVIKVEDRRTAPPPTFEEARDQLSEDLSREIVDDKIKELRAHAKVETFALDGGPLPPDDKAGQDKTGQGKADPGKPGQAKP